MGLHATGYIRVSTDDQARNGVSLEAQRAKIIAYAKLHDLTLDGTHSDEGISGKRADNRPGLTAALDAVCASKGVLIVYSLSRLARNTRDCIEIADRIDKCGANLASITEKIDTTSSMGRFFFRLMASLGELERDQISERTTAALQHKKRGRRAYSRTPYGFRRHGDALVPVERERAVIERMRSMRADGSSFNRIAEALNVEGTPTKDGLCWYASTVRQILNNDLHANEKTAAS